MSTHPHVMALLEDRVPLALLVDLAGLGPSSQEILREERYDDGAVARSLAGLASVDDQDPHARESWTA